MSLKADHPQTPPARAHHKERHRFESRGKTFTERLEAMLNDAEQVFHVHLRKVGGARDPFRAQFWHIAHMFYWNSYKHQHPQPFEHWRGHRVISFRHAQDPHLVFGEGWDYRVPWSEFLRDKHGRVAKRIEGSAAW